MSRFYYWALNRGIVVRWILYIVPVLALLWIPGIVGLTAAKNATVWHVRLVRFRLYPRDKANDGQLWWSIWLSVLWGGFWASTAAWLMIPGVWHNTIGSIIPTARKYTDVIRALGR